MVALHPHSRNTAVMHQSSQLNFLDLDYTKNEFDRF